MGTTGYCMGGAITMRTAAAVPERIGAGASFHGWKLVSDAPDSPHLLADRIKARYLFAIARTMMPGDPEAKTVLRESFDSAGLEAEIEVYPGALHGWCTPDSHVYNEAPGGTSVEPAAGAVRNRPVLICPVTALAPHRR